MSISTYLGKRILGLPAYDSAELMAAKKYSPRPDNVFSLSAHDLYSKPMDHRTLGAISPVSDADDLLSSKELEEKASEIYALCDRHRH